MTFAQFFKASSYCLIGSGFVAVAATGRVGWIPTILFAAVLAGSWFLDTAEIRRRVPGWVINAAGLVYLPFCVLDVRLLSRSLLAAVLHLLLFTAAVKLLTLSRDRDYILLYLISFAQLLAASTLTVNILFLAAFLVFLVSGISTLILFEMRRTNARMQKEAEVQPLVIPKRLRGTGLELFSPFPAGLICGMIIAITGLIIIVLVPTFFLLPRVASGVVGAPLGEKRYTSGFSEQVELGQIGVIKKSDAVVMRVRTDKQPSEMPADLKWRGLAFDQYDGKSWKRSSRPRNAIPVQGRFYKLENSTQGTNLIQQTFFLEALSTDIIFATHKALAVSRDVGSLSRDDAETLYAVRLSDRKLRYSAVSDPIRPDPANISDLLPIPAGILTVYTQVPDMDPRIAQLTRRVTASANSRYAKALAIERHLSSNYTYSLVLGGSPNNPDPLAMFLFDVRKGHCEYFASAMTIMLRQIGIPARLVNGFRTGEYNSIAESWTVRQYDAHSWVEAYFPPYGWVEFDPTPPDPQHSRPAFFRWISDIADAVDLWWWDGIVNYDRSRQSRVITAMQTAAANMRSAAGALIDKVQDAFRSAIDGIRSRRFAAELKTNWLLWILAAGIAFLLFKPSLRRRMAEAVRRTIYRKRARIIAASFYAEALELLGARDIKRRREQTPIEFALSLEQHPAGKPLMALTCMYNAVRFGPPESGFDHVRAKALLRSLRSALQ